MWHLCDIMANYAKNSTTQYSSVEVLIKQRLKDLVHVDRRENSKDSAEAFSLSLSLF